MKNNIYVFTGALVVIIVLVTAWVLMPSDKIGYVAEVDTQVDSLQTELSTLKASIALGDLDPQTAVQVRAHVTDRLSAITAAIETAQHTQLTPAERASIVASLVHMKQMLTEYMGTLHTLDTIATESAIRSGIQAEVSPNQSLVSLFDDTVGTLENHVEDVLDDAPLVSEEDTNSDADSDEVSAEEQMSTDNTAVSSDDDVSSEESLMMSDEQQSDQGMSDDSVQSEAYSTEQTQ